MQAPPSIEFVAMPPNPSLNWTSLTRVFFRALVAAGRLA